MKKVIYIMLSVVVLVCVLSTTVYASYSPSAAITYSNRYAVNPYRMNGYGEGYNYYSKDCTNFVSQCLYAGGFSQDSTWYSTVSFSANSATRTDSNTWVNANLLKNYLKDNNYATKIGSWSKDGTPSPYHTYAYVNNSDRLTANNAGKVVLFYDWDGNGQMNHSAFFVKNNSESTYSNEGTGDLINQHTENRKQVFWRPDIRQADNDNFTQRATTRVYAFEIN